MAADASTSKPLWSIMGCRSPQTGCTHSLGRQALRRHEFRFGPIIVREQPLEGLELGQVVEDDVRIVRMMDKVVLMVGLGWIEGLKRLYAGRDASLKYVCVIELSDVAELRSGWNSKISKEISRCGAYLPSGCAKERKREKEAATNSEKAGRSIASLAASGTAPSTRQI